MKVKMTFTILKADNLKDLNAAINLKLHLLCLEVPEYIEVKEPKMTNNTFYTTICVGG
jgi:hypothetical protein